MACNCWPGCNRAASAACKPPRANSSTKPCVHRSVRSTSAPRRARLPNPPNHNRTSNPWPAAMSVMPAPCAWPDKAIAAGQGFEVRLWFGGFGNRARRGADVDRTLRCTQGFVEEFALGGLQAADDALLQPGQLLHAIAPEKLLAAVPHQCRTLGAQQLAGLGADREDLPAEAHRQQALPRRFEVLPTAVECEDDLIRITGVEHPAFNLADGHGQQRSAVVNPAEWAFASEVEDAEDVALRAVDRH